MNEHKNIEEEDCLTKYGISEEDAQTSNVVAGFSYVLFFIPLIIRPESKFGRFHANQSLVLTIITIINNTILRSIPHMGLSISSLISLAVLALGIMGLINGLSGKAKKLPIIGNIVILK